MATTTIYPIEYIVSTPGICGGKPRIAGHRIKVQLIVEDYKRGMTVGEIADAYELMPAQIHAALAYYYDHREEIDSQIREDGEFVKQMMAQAGPNPVTERLKRLGITLAQAHALLDYYHEHREEVDRQIAAAGLDQEPVVMIEKLVKLGLVEKLPPMEQADETA